MSHTKSIPPNLNTHTIDPISQTISDDQSLFVNPKLSPRNIMTSNFTNNNCSVKDYAENLESSLLCHPAIGVLVQICSDMHRRNTSAEDQHGCRFLQKKLEGGTKDDRHTVDQFRNYLVDTCNADRNVGVLVKICSEMHGTLLEKLTKEHQEAGIISALMPGAGVHVRRNTLPKDQHGCRFLQKTLEGGAKDDQVGNYFVQKLVDTCSADLRTWLERLTNEQQEAQNLTPGIVVLTTDIDGYHLIQYRAKHFPMELKKEWLKKADSKGVKSISNTSSSWSSQEWLKKADSKGVKAISNTSSSWSSQGSKDDTTHSHKKAPQPHGKERRAKWGGRATVPFHVVHSDLSEFTYQVHLELYDSYLMLERYARTVIFGVGNAGVPAITYKDFFSDRRRPLRYCRWEDFNPLVMYGAPAGFNIF